MALSLKNRISKESDFKNVLRLGRSVRGVFIMLKFVAGIPIARFGISVPAKVLPKASDRNRVKRILSEKTRIDILPKAGGYDTVIIVIKSPGPDEEKMLQELVVLARQSGII